MDYSLWDVNTWKKKDPIQIEEMFFYFHLVENILFLDFWIVGRGSFFISFIVKTKLYKRVSLDCYTTNVSKEP